MKDDQENAQFILASENLKGTVLSQTSPLPNVGNIRCLEAIAFIRAALDALSSYLGNDFEDNIKHFEALPTCLEAAKTLCSDASRFPIQLFLLKQLVRHDPNGIDGVKERCKRKELEWIMPPHAEVKKIIFTSSILVLFEREVVGGLKVTATEKEDNRAVC